LQGYFKHFNLLISVYSFTSKEAIKSSINISLTYLRGLEIPVLTEELINRIKVLYEGVIYEETNLDKLFKVSLFSVAKTDY
tara:strand:- start:756 stop:998 length:243 start_codon:yes stop_codon:yes gene_type:complete